MTLTFREGYISFDCVPAILAPNWPRVGRNWRGSWLSQQDREKCMEKVFVVPKLHFSGAVKDVQSNYKHCACAAFGAFA